MEEPMAEAALLYPALLVTGLASALILAVALVRVLSHGSPAKA